MPDKCEKDLIEIGDDIDLDIEFTFVSRVEEVLEFALGKDIFDGKARGPQEGMPPRKKTRTRKASSKKTASKKTATKKTATKKTATKKSTKKKPASDSGGAPAGA